jgi:preprotein translocase subunit YajC
MSFFISDAMANAAPAPQAAGPDMLIMLIMFAAVFYFMIWRPQSKKNKEHKNMLAELSKGDEIVTTGGILGKITNITDDYTVIELDEGVSIKVQKQAITACLPKGTLKSIK